MRRAGFALFLAVIVGGVCFIAGFFGPMILAPQANQGPMLGIFITGPLGFIAGGIVGLVLPSVAPNNRLLRYFDQMVK